MTVSGEMSEQAVSTREGHWSWAAPTAGAVLWAMTVATFGFGLVLFWIGLASNATLLLGFVVLLVVLVTGNAPSE